MKLGAIKRGVCLAGAGVALALVAAPTADAAPWLSMPRAKAKAHSDVRFIVDGLPHRLSCYRMSASTVACDWSSSDSGVTCYGSLREVLKSYGGPYYHSGRRVRCY
jgi:hypothetical protein